MTEKTLVVFRYWKDSREVIALFPEESDITYARPRGLCSSYMHVGQHGLAHYDHVVENTLLATPEQYALLLEELQVIGYDLDIREEWTRR